MIVIDGATHVKKTRQTWSCCEFVQVRWQASVAAAGRRATNGEGGDSSIARWSDAGWGTTSKTPRWSGPRQEHAQWVGESSTLSTESARQCPDRGSPTSFLLIMVLNRSSWLHSSISFYFADAWTVYRLFIYTPVDFIYFMPAHLSSLSKIIINQRESNSV